MFESECRVEVAALVATLYKNLKREMKYSIVLL